MQSRWSIRRRSSWALAVAPILVMGSFALATAPATATSRAAQAVSASEEHFTVTPNATNNLDCNGWSLKYKPVFATHRELCTDPRGAKYGKGYASSLNYYTSKGRFIDNGHYVGHDEPSVKFISTTPGSGNTMTYLMRLPRDPVAPPTNTGSVTHYVELSVAPWFGLPICDPASYPQNPCTPDSDTNTGLNSPTDAGSAFMELQFYPPGFTPFADNVSCSATKGCAAMTIDSLESEFNFANLNPNCPEPTNFGYLQRNGVPTGPPSPQLMNVSTGTPNAQTLEMNPGDVLKVQISDPHRGAGPGFTTKVTDLTTGRSGFMVASAANGFMNTNYKTCAGSPHTFHAEYSSARIQNQVPWAALETGVLMEQETGHSEVCASLANRDPFTFPGFVDKRVFDTCVGGPSEGKTTRGEGGCNLTTGNCVNPTTEGTTGPIACPSKSFVSGQLCEFADGICLPQGTRTVTVNGQPVKETSPVNTCAANRFQNGDLDFDGVPYQKHSWPDGSPSHPTSFRYVGPFMANGRPYPSIQFETDAPGSAFLCNVFTGLNCDLPPLAAHFYPFYTMTNKQPLGSPVSLPAKACVWNFGNNIQQVTTQNFGQQAQYGAPNLARFGGTSISAPAANPEFSGHCPAFTQP